MNSGLPSNVYSPDHLRFAVEELERYVSTMLMMNRGAQGITLPELSPESMSLLESGLEEDKHEDPSAIIKLTAGLAHLLNTAVVMTITLSAPAAHSLKQELVGWLRVNVSPTTLVEFHVDPDIAGGMVLRSINHVYDESFRQRLLANAPKFTEILSRV